MRVDPAAAHHVDQRLRSERRRSLTRRLVHGGHAELKSSARRSAFATRPMAAVAPRARRIDACSTSP
jgi:hypothetical protein